MTGPLGATNRAPAPPGVRVVMDIRSLQEPDRAPLTATYLDGLLEAYDTEPLAGESFSFLLRSDLDDPDTGLSRPGHRGPPPPAAHAAPALGGADRRSVPAPRRHGRDDLAGRPGWRVGGRLSHRRGRPVADHRGHADGRDPAGPRTVAAPGPVHPVRDVTVRPAPAGSTPARRGGGRRGQSVGRAARPSAAPRQGGPAAGHPARPPRGVRPTGGWRHGRGRAIASGSASA